MWPGELFEHVGPHFPGRFPGTGVRLQPHPPLLLGRFPQATLCPSVDLCRRPLAEDGASEADVDALLQRSGALRHVVIAPSEAMTGYIERANEVNEPHELDDFLDRACVDGTASTQAERLLEVDELGLGTAIDWVDFGGIAPEHANATLEALIAEVLPAVATATPASPVLLLAREVRHSLLAERRHPLLHILAVAEMARGDPLELDLLGQRVATALLQLALRPEDRERRRLGELAGERLRLGARVVDQAVAEADAHRLLGPHLTAGEE